MGGIEDNSAIVSGGLLRTIEECCCGGCPGHVFEEGLNEIVAQAIL